MGTHALEARTGLPVRTASQASRHLRWLAGGFVLAFLVPFVFADLLELPRDLYYAVYVVAVAAYFGLWVRATGQSFAEMVRRRWLLAVALGLAVAGILTLMVLRTEDATARPDGIELVGAVAWRGLVYGLADGLLLSAFPILAVFAAFAGTALRRRLLGVVAIALVALVASLAMTAVYHAGYSDFRSAELRKPVAGDAVWSLPTLVTLNPIGAPIAHAGMHTAAVLHSYETDT
ncbi:MAG TPA: hypothetical protein VD769_01820, partial [Gaiellaceae bacterium]|nr:hypothetical protein [Gaiellaceae bacterium]